MWWTPNLRTANLTVVTASFSPSSVASRGATRSQRALTYLIEEVSVRAYLLVFAAVVLGCGWLYSFLTAHGHGVNTSSMGFLDGVYFSIVTVASLGYGDLYPVGFSRAIAGVEVLFGLAFMGIMIAKVTSRRLSYHVRRLFVSDAQQRLDDFVARFASMREPLGKVTKDLGHVYERTPEPRPPSVEKTEVLARFRASIEQLHAGSIALRKYFSFEVEQDVYFSIVPEESVQRVGETLDEVLYQLGQLIISLPAEAKPEVVDGKARREVWEALRELEHTANILREHCPNQATVECFRRVQETCKTVRNSHFTTPTLDAVPDLPNQEALESDAPQG